MSNLLTTPMKFIHSILQRWIAYCHIVRVMDLDQRKLWYQINTIAISQLKQSVSRKWLGLGRKNGLDQQLLSSLENDCPNNIGKSACSSFNPQSLSVFQILSADQLDRKENPGEISFEVHSAWVAMMRALIPVCSGFLTSKPFKWAALPLLYDKMPIDISEALSAWRHGVMISLGISGK